MTVATVRPYPRREPDETVDDARVLNWARNATLAEASSVETPPDEDALRQVLATGRGQVRMIGSRMSPGRLLEVGTADDTLLDLRHLSGRLALDDASATFAGATPLSQVYEELTALGRMLPASPGVIASQTLAGALATGTHGQGLQQSTIGDSVLSLRVVLADGSVLELDRSHPWFGAVQLGLGVLGVVTAVTLATVPLAVYACVKDAVPATTLDTDLETWNRDHVLTKAWWFPDEDQVHVWAAQTADEAELERYHAGGDVLLERPVTSDAMNRTVDQTLVHMREDTKIVDANGKPFRTVTRFKDFSDVTGDIYQVFCRGIATPQINVEVGVPLARAGAVVRAIKEWHAATRPHLHYPIILRCTGPSDSWLSPAYGQETCFFGFVVYYAADGTLSEDGVDFLTAVERLLAAEGGRPHWGKYFDESLYDWSALYPRWDAFRDVRRALDPDRRFENAFTAGLFDVRGARRVRAWVTLLTNPGYVPGVRVLNASLAGVGSAYPLVVMVTPAIDADTRRTLADEGCQVREVEPLRPPEGLRDRYANARFAEVWTKLAVWRLTDLERVVCLDADMLVVADMDELFDLDLGDGEIAACHACRCNPNKIASYPASWTPQRCHYSHVRVGTAPGLPTGPAGLDDYLNGGTLVLRPDESTFADLMAALADVEDLTRYPFAEQDFLNERFAGRWRPLPYVYNALKTLPHQHPGLWDDAAVKNIHFIIDKPWQRTPDPQDRYHALNQRWWDAAGPVLAGDAAAGGARQRA